MQLGYPQNFLERLIEYGISLKQKFEPNKCKFNIKVLGFINFKRNNTFKSNTYCLAKFSPETGEFIQKVDDFMNIIIIDLYEIQQKLEKNEKIFILGKEIGTIGKNWLKLLGLRHWGKKLENNCYEIPEFNINIEMNSTLNYLQKLKNEQLFEYYNAEKEYYDSINKAASELAAEQKLKTFLIIYKTAKDLKLEYFEENNIINFSELDINKVESLWGKNDEYKTKLDELKEYIGKKRKKIDNDNK